MFIDQNWLRVAEIIALFLSLFIPAMIAVLGSFAVYLYRSKRRAEGLRRAFLAELNSLDALDHMEYMPVPASMFLIPTSVFESSANDLGLLSEEEVEALTAYYTSAEIINVRLESEDLEPEIEFRGAPSEVVWEKLRQAEQEEKLDILQEYMKDQPFYSTMKSTIEKRDLAVERLENNIGKNWYSL